MVFRPTLFFVREEGYVVLRYEDRLQSFDHIFDSLAPNNSFGTLISDSDGLEIYNRSGDLLKVAAFGTLMILDAGKSNLCFRLSDSIDSLLDKRGKNIVFTNVVELDEKIGLNISGSMQFISAY